MGRYFVHQFKKLQVLDACDYLLKTCKKDVSSKLLK